MKQKKLDSILYVRVPSELKLWLKAQAEKYSEEYGGYFSEATVVRQILVKTKKEDGATAEQVNNSGVDYDPAS